MKKISIILTVVAFCSCSHSKVEPWIDYTDVFDKNGRVASFNIKRNTQTVYQYLSINEVNDVLSHTPPKKIDKIIETNKDWQFVFYCRCNLADTTRLINCLRKYDCSFPVIVDSNREFLKTNNLDTLFSAIGYICNNRGAVTGCSVIGTSQSYFDSEFSYAKYKTAKKARGFSFHSK